MLLSYQQQTETLLPAIEIESLERTLSKIVISANMSSGEEQDVISACKLFTRNFAAVQPSTFRMKCRCGMYYVVLQSKKHEPARKEEEEKSKKG